MNTSLIPSFCCGSSLLDRLCGLAVKTLAQRPGGTGSIPGRVKPRTLKLVLVADPPGVWHCGFSAKSGRPGVRIMGLDVVYAALRTSQCGSTLSIVPSAVSDITLKLKRDVIIQTTNQPFYWRRLIQKFNGQNDTPGQWT
ncbi:hypothetical protein ElyMa_004546000 [Elysia marginata]|uniref:Uncharacterized protein n=1 Tax=Elysia marginata TaxID=1093978 RepID=A0AAV4HPQ0_9GAST|nr:hypothetical protein ElyMa_004546000 [Elysia marginata]